ncbi:MAG: hypothetical protein LQ341_003241 [Variospora aurantia]|nr:MAG: hypothetical protein LQ341_003241 [Variospora aurantia]
MYSEFGNQYVNTTSQLDAGVRLLTAQVHNNDGAWHLCHTSCSFLDAGPLSSWLAEIKAWLDQNPYDVVTILLVNSDNAAAGDLDPHFQKAAIKPYTYTPRTTTTPSITWPTLNNLISTGQRLVTFVADMRPSAAAPYLLDEFYYIFENPFGVLSLSDFSCVPERPAIVQGQTSAALQSGRLPLMNHFLDVAISFGIQVPDVGNLSVTNAISGPVGNLGDAAAACASEYTRVPAFVLVNFFEQGSAIDTVDRLNGITPMGRASASLTGSAGGTPSGTVAYTSHGGSSLVSFTSLLTVVSVASFFVVT